MKKSSTKTINKRSGFFYGSSDGHPIVWNNDWNSLIQKEVAARDEFSRKFMTGKIRPQPPVYADISMDNTNWNSLLRSTYSDLGRWGDETFRESVPHKVLKKEAELPSLPGTPERTDRLSEFAYKHARFQLGKHVNQDMLTSKVEKHKSKKKSHEGEEKSNEKGEGEEGKGELRDLLAACLSTDSRGIKKAAALAHKPSSSQRRAKSVEPSSTADKELWKTTSGELGSWGSMTQRKYWPARTSKTIVEAKKVDVNRPVYPSSPRPQEGARQWQSNYSNLGNWGADTFRKWIPAKVGKEKMEGNKSGGVEIVLPPPRIDRKLLVEPIKSSSYIGPQKMW
uniref:Uncharacterized protein n=2 Tax=Guillardia theta TaxID=55529 RepID=A0A7S4KFX7_GUITH|mmetsp:Transcript_24210/g.78922  ORF Transcript_24210/g.78922 Transcript_24210/m.78922 type:complete len:338 (+) Transcript_24210:111-1124(+)